MLSICFPKPLPRDVEEKAAAAAFSAVRLRGEQEQHTQQKSCAKKKLLTALRRCDKFKVVIE